MAPVAITRQNGKTRVAVGHETSGTPVYASAKRKNNKKITLECYRRDESNELIKTGYGSISVWHDGLQDKQLFNSTNGPVKDYERLYSLRAMFVYELLEGSSSIEDVMKNAHDAKKRSVGSKPRKARKLASKVPTTSAPGNKPTEKTEPTTSQEGGQTQRIDQDINNGTIDQESLHKHDFGLSMERPAPPPAGTSHDSAIVDLIKSEDDTPPPSSTTTSSEAISRDLHAPYGTRSSTTTSASAPLSYENQQQDAHNELVRLYQVNITRMTDAALQQHVARMKSVRDLLDLFGTAGEVAGL